MDYEKILAIIGAVFMTWFNQYYSTIVPLFICLIIVMAIDYITGVTSAFMQNNLNSKIGLHGILKKTGNIAAIVVGACLDYFLLYVGSYYGVELNMPFCILIASFLLVNEFISILENLDQMGINLPPIVKKMLEKISKTIGESDNDMEQ